MSRPSGGTNTGFLNRGSQVRVLPGALVSPVESEAFGHLCSLLGDLDGDDSVEIADFLMLPGNWGVSS